MVIKSYMNSIVIYHINIVTSVTRYLLHFYIIKSITVAAVMRLPFLHEKPMKIIITSFLLTVIVFLFAAFVAAAIFGVNSFKNEDDGEGV